MATRTEHSRPRSGSPAEADQGLNHPKKQKTNKAGKKVPPLALQLRARIHQAAKDASRHDDAFAAYEEALQCDIKLSTDCLVTLLFLAAGGDQWESYVYSGEKREEFLKTERLEKCEGILARLRESSGGSPLVEMCYTALARKEAILGNGDAALQHALNIPHSYQKKNRCFMPALAAFGRSGNGACSVKAYDDLLQAGLEPGEPEFSKVLEAFSKDSTVEWPVAEKILAHMAKETTELCMDTIKILRELFQSRSSLDQHSISTSICTVREEDGYCALCDNSLQAIDLDEVEYAQFAEGISSLAKKQEKHPNEFDGFIQWLERHGPFGVVVDAANVAFYNQNFESGGFSFAQIEAVVDRVSVDYPGLKPLVVLHVNRTRGPLASTAKAKAFLDAQVEQNRFYAAPMGSNDDWYWMYAAVAAGPKGILISNDEMRDHLFNLLAPKYFKKWKQRHQVRYTFSGEPDTLSFQHPPPFTRCTQVLRNENGGSSWMFPILDENEEEISTTKEWLCCTFTPKKM
jgi:proteinaceous RNase P